MRFTLVPVSKKLRLSILGLSMLLLTLAFSLVSVHTPAHAAAHDAAPFDDGTVLLVHGYNGDAGGSTPKGYDCQDFWNNEINAINYVGGVYNRYVRIKTVGYYSENTNCTINLNSSVYTKDFQGDVTLEGGNAHSYLSRNTPIEHIAYRLAWAIAQERELNGGRPVSIIADSLGGVVARWMAVQIIQRNPNYPVLSMLSGTNVATFGSPFQGTDYASFGISEQAREMTPGSAFLTTMDAEVRLGTNSWYSFTSNFNALSGGGDGFVSAKSACLHVRPPSSSNVAGCYSYDNPAYTHGDYKNDTDFSSFSDAVSYRDSSDINGIWRLNYECGAAYLAAVQII